MKETATKETTEIEDIKHEPLWLQWVIEGPKQGTMVQTTGIITEDGMTFYELSDKTRVNVDVVGNKKVIMQIADPDNPYSFEKIVHEPAPMKEIKGADKEVYYAPDESLSSKDRVGWTEYKLIPPKKIIKQPMGANPLEITSAVTKHIVVPKPVEDPFITMMNEVELSEKVLDVEILVNMFPQDFFIMNSKYMKGSEDKMIKFMTDKIIKSDEFKIQLESAIKSFYLKKNDND